METITFSACTKELLKERLGLKQLWTSPILDEWFKQAQLMELDELEVKSITKIQQTFVRRCDDWNEYELKQYFISPIVVLVDFNTNYFSVFAERPIEAEIGQYKLIGKSDLLIAKGESYPKIPYFCFSEYKRQISPEGNPVYQALGEMLVAQQLNIHSHPIYGMAVIGKLWHFMVLNEQTYCVSKSFATDDEEVFLVVKILKMLKLILIDIAKLDAN